MRDPATDREQAALALRDLFVLTGGCAQSALLYGVIFGSYVCGGVPRLFAGRERTGTKRFLARPVDVHDRFLNV